MNEITQKGGKFVGNSHKNNGIPINVVETHQHLEVEGNEPLIPKEALLSNTINTYTGTNFEILDKINKSIGAKGLNQKATEIHVGDVVICKKTLTDKTIKTLKGTNKQIVSAINAEAGCNIIEQGATITTKNTVKQFKQGGEINANFLKLVEDLYKDHYKAIQRINEINTQINDDNCVLCAKDLTKLFDKELKHHFTEEEKDFFPKIKITENSKIITTLVAEHSWFLIKIYQLEDNPTPNLINNICEKLVNHINTEEKLMAIFMPNPYKNNTMENSEKPSEEQKINFFKKTCNELHYLYEKPVLEWDGYDFSNWKSLNKKAKNKLKSGGEIMKETDNKLTVSIKKKIVKDILYFLENDDNQEYAELLEAKESIQNENYDYDEDVLKELELEHLIDEDDMSVLSQYSDEFISYYLQKLNQLEYKIADNLDNLSNKIQEDINKILNDYKFKDEDGNFINKYEVSATAGHSLSRSRYINVNIKSLESLEEFQFEIRFSDHEDKHYSGNRLTIAYNADEKIISDAINHLFREIDIEKLKSGGEIMKETNADDYFVSNNVTEFMFLNKEKATNLANKYNVPVIEDFNHYYVPIATNKLEQGGEIENGVKKINFEPKNTTEFSTTLDVVLKLEKTATTKQEKFEVENLFYLIQNNFFEQVVSKHPTILLKMLQIIKKLKPSQRFNVYNNIFDLDSKTQASVVFLNKLKQPFWRLIPEEFKKVHKIKQVLFNPTPGNKGLGEIISPFTGKDELRPVLQGVYFDKENSNIVATDAHKMLVLYDKLSISESKICKMGANLKSEIKGAEKYGEKITYDNDNCLVIDGQYPRYKSVIPTDFKFLVNVDANKLYKFASILLKNKLINRVTNEITLKYDDFYYSVNANNLKIILKAMLQLNYNKLDFLFTETTRALVAIPKGNARKVGLDTDTDMALLMPILGNEFSRTWIYDLKNDCLENYRLEKLGCINIDDDVSEEVKDPQVEIEKQEKIEKEKQKQEKITKKLKEADQEKTAKKLQEIEQKAIKEAQLKKDKEQELLLTNAIESLKVLKTLVKSDAEKESIQQEIDKLDKNGKKENTKAAMWLKDYGKPEDWDNDKTFMVNMDQVTIEELPNNLKAHWYKDKRIVFKPKQIVKSDCNVKIFDAEGNETDQFEITDQTEKEARKIAKIDGRVKDADDWTLLPKFEQGGEINGTKYTTHKIEVGKTKYEVMVAEGKSNYINIRKLTANPFLTTGTDFKNFDEAIKHYKNPTIKVELLKLQTGITSKMKKGGEISDIVGHWIRTPRSIYRIIDIKEISDDNIKITYDGGYKGSLEITKSLTKNEILDFMNGKIVNESWQDYDLWKNKMKKGGEIPNYRHNIPANVYGYIFTKHPKLTQSYASVIKHDNGAYSIINTTGEELRVSNSNDNSSQYFTWKWLNENFNKLDAISENEKGILIYKKGGEISNHNSKNHK